jgi:hypothetical protein
MVDWTGEAMAVGRLRAEPSPIPMCIGIEAATQPLQWLRNAVCTNTAPVVAPLGGCGFARDLVGMVPVRPEPSLATRRSWPALRVIGHG